MKRIIILFLFLVALISIKCTSTQTFRYDRYVDNAIKRIAIQQPADDIIPATVSAEYLQKMLTYMIYSDKGFFVQPVDTTNRRMALVNSGGQSSAEMARVLEADALLEYDFFEYTRDKNNEITGFSFSLSLVDLNRGKRVWQSVREHRGNRMDDTLPALKQYMQSKLQNPVPMPYFVELYELLKDAMASLENPEFTDAELEERLLSIEEPF